MPKKKISEHKLKSGSALNVSKDLGLDDCDVSNLVIFKNNAHNSSGYKCRWLPKEKKDIRPDAGRNKSGKRIPYVGSTGEIDPFDAGKAAIKWLDDLQEEIEKLKHHQKHSSSHSLHHYWEIWYGRFTARRDKSDRNKADRLNDWNGKDWGIAEQEWSKKSVDEITARDISDYFDLLDSRGDGTKGSMAERKKTQKTLLNKLNKEAQSDFPELRPFVYPVIEGKSGSQVEHLTRKEWDKLIAKVIELSGDTANKDLTEDQYQNLEWSSRDRFNQRNWVDLYDAITLMFYFYLRAEDIPRIQSEWFRDMGEIDGDPTIYVYLEKTKQDRLKQETEHFYPDGYEKWKRIEKRKPSGYISFPYCSRQKGREEKSNVGETANKLLQTAVELCKIKKRENVTLTTIRHTSFRVTLEEMPPLNSEQEMRNFADNGNTSIEMLRDTYLKYVHRGKLASKARKALPKNTWSLKKRVEL